MKKPPPQTFREKGLARRTRTCQRVSGQQSPAPQAPGARTRGSRQVEAAAGCSGRDTPRLLVSQLCYQRPRQDSHLRRCNRWGWSEKAGVQHGCLSVTVRKREASTAPAGRTGPARSRGPSQQGWARAPRTRQQRQTESTSQPAKSAAGSAPRPTLRSLAGGHSGTPHPHPRGFLRLCSKEGRTL